MESKSDKTPLVIIVGQTASGKSALAMELAHRFNGEIIAADSRTIYKSLDIGTAKPSLDDQQSVPHYLIDVVDPNETFSAAEFKRRAVDAIDDISSRGKLPILVGGTGLYIDAVAYDFSFASKPDITQRDYLTSLSVEQLQMIIRERGIPMPLNARNPRHLVRAIETKGEEPQKKELRSNTLIIGIDVPREILKKRIEQRIDVMLGNGFIQETKHAAVTYGWDAPGLQSTGYKAFHLYIAGDITLQQAKTLFVHNDLHLAKRQKTWFKRNKSIHWISKVEESVDLVTTLLNK